MVLVMAQPPHSFHPILSLCNNSASLRQRNLKRYGSNPKNLHVINAVKPITIPPKTENIQIKKRNRKRRKKKQVIVSVSTDGQLGTCISGQLDTCLKKWDNDLDEISDSPLGDDAIESLDEVSDVPFDTDFEEESVDYSLDADISRGVEITIGFRKSALKYLKYKPVEFFKPKIYYFSKDRSIVSCLNVKPGQENSAQIEEIVHYETVEDTRQDTTHDDTGVSEDTTEKKNIDKDYAKSTADQSQEEKKESHSQNDSVGDSSKQDQPKLDLFQGKVFIQKDIDKSERPLLGLEYILEIWSAIGGNLLNFYCLLCKKYLKRHTVLDHVASYFHKVTFMVKHFPTRGVVFPQAPPYLLNKDMKILLEKYCKKIDKSCKRLDLHITCEEYFKKHFKEITEAVENSLHYDENYFSSGDGKEIEIFESDEDEGTEDNAVIEEVIPMDGETIVKPVADCVSPKSLVEVLCSEKDASDENYLIMDESNSVASASDLDGSAVKQASINKSITNADGESFVKSVCAKSEQLSASSVSENVSECENSVVSKKVGIDFGGKLKTSPKGKSIQGVFTKDNKKATNKEPSKNGDNSPKMSSNQYSGSKKAFSAPTGKLISKTKNCEGKMLPCDVPQNLCITPMSKKKKCVHGKVTSSSPGYRKVAKKALMSNKNWKPLKWPQSSASMDIACVQDKLKTANEKGVSAKEIWENLPNNASKKFDARRKGTKPGGEAHIIGRLHHSKFEYKSVPEGTEYKSRGIGSSTFAKGREQMGKCESVYPSTVNIGDNKVHDARQHNLKKVSPTTKLARHSRRVIRKSSRSPVLNRHKIHQKRHTRSPIKRASRSPSTRRSRLELEEQYRNMFQKKSKSPVPTRSEIVRRSRSPIMQQSRSPVRHRIIISPIRRHVISSSRRQSRSPIRRQSRSPVRRQSRSPVRRQSRSPIRRQSRSPVRRRTRSPVRRQVRSPVRRQVRSPVRRKSRSPLRRRSRSATKKSRSPVRRESIRRRSRSLIRREVRTQRKRLSRSPTREWSGSPNFRRSSFSLSRSQSEEPIVESENNNLYTLDSRVSISVQNQRQDTWHPTEQIIPNIGHQFHNQTQYMSAGIPQPPLQFQQFHNPNQIFNSVNMPSGSTAAQPYSQLPTSSAPLNTQIPNFPANINFPPPQLHQAMKPNSGSAPVSTYQGLSSQAYPVTNQAQAPQSHTGMNQPSQSVPFISNKNIFQDMRNTVSKLFGGPDASKTSPALQQEIARIVGLSTDAQNENVQYINEANKGNSGQLNKGYESEISSLSKAFIQNQIFTKASEENNNLGMSFLNFNELLKVALIKELPQKFFSQTSQHTGNQPEPFLMNPLSNLQAQTGKPQTYSNLSASNSFSLMKNSGGATDQLRSGMDSKVSYCDRSANANRGNIFPIVKQEPSQFGDNKYMENVQFSMRSQDHQLSGANVTVESKQKASLAQRLASVLVKLGMTDMPGNLLSEMLAKIGAFIKSPSHEISESEIISILKSCGYISHNL